jgi:hypothetical protein
MKLQELDMEHLCSVVVGLAVSEMQQSSAKFYLEATRLTPKQWRGEEIW